LQNSLPKRHPSLKKGGWSDSTNQCPPRVVPLGQRGVSDCCLIRRRRVCPVLPRPPGLLKIVINDGVAKRESKSTYTHRERRAERAASLLFRSSLAPPSVHNERALTLYGDIYSECIHGGLRFARGADLPAHSILYSPEHILAYGCWCFQSQASLKLQIVHFPVCGAKCTLLRDCARIIAFAPGMRE
jgi:hypothetical protein